MAKLVQCRIDLNRHEAIREGGAVVLEDGWSLEKPYPYVRPAFAEPFIGTVMTTERIWDRHRPVSWWTPWRLLTQPFRPAHRIVWVKLPEPGVKIRTVGISEETRTNWHPPVVQAERRAPAEMPLARRDELIRDVFGHPDTNIRMKQFEFAVPIEGEFCYDSRNRFPLGTMPIHPTLMALTKIPGVSWVLLTNATTVSIIRDWTQDWPEIEAKASEILQEHDHFVMKGGL